MKNTMLLVASALVVACGGESGNTSSPVGSRPTSPPAASAYVWDSGWNKRADHFFLGQPAAYSGVGFASDPSVIKDGDLYRMFYSCLDLTLFAQTGVEKDIGSSICQVTSTNARSWDFVNETEPTVKGRVVPLRDDEWDQSIETAEAIKFNGTYFLYYSGYDSTAHPTLEDEGYPSSFALATSSDGVNFTRYNNGEPILRPSEGAYDSDAMYSPSIVALEDGSLFMAYAGHCFENCDNGAQIALLGAMSSDGYQWTKLEEPLLTASNAPEWGVAEPGLVKDPQENIFYLYYTLIIDDPDTRHQIGLAASVTGPEGPYVVQESNILLPEIGYLTSFNTRAVIAPEVIVDNDRLRMWYIEHGPTDADWAIGYAESLMR